MTIQEYPRCKYHANLPVVVVNNEKEEKELGPGWVNHPNDVGTATTPSPVTKQSPNPNPAPHAPTKTSHYDKEE